MKLPPALPPIAWRPNPGAQVLFLSCPVFECLLEGNRGGGKTDALLMDFAQFVGLGFGSAWTGILFRETYKQLGDVVKKSKRWFRMFFPAARFLESNDTYKWVFPGGEELLLRVGVCEDDYWDYHGHEYPWVGFEELTNWRDPAFYEMMQSCCRSSRPGMPRRVRATTNPYGRGHGWVKERFQISDDGRSNAGRILRDAQGRQRTYVHSDMQENRPLMDNDPEYVASIQGTKDPNRRKAWLEGRWDINIGAFLEGAWDAAKHVVKPFPIPAHWKVWMAMDWGYGKPYSIGWYAKDPEGKTYRFRELYGCAKDEKTGKWLPNVGVKETPDVVAKRIKDREEHDERLGLEMSLRLTGPDLFAKGGGQYGVQNTHAQTFRRHGLAFRPWWAGPGSRKAGALLVRQALELDEFAVFSTCEHFIRTVPTLEPDPNDPDDVDTEAEDHCFTADTPVVTARGVVPISEVRAGDLVVNHEGRWVKSRGARLTRRYAHVVRLYLANGQTITCTPDHRFYMGGMLFRRASDLLDEYCYGLLEKPCESTSSATPSRNSKACGTTDAAGTFSARECGCTARCGSACTGETCRTDSRCTTEMKTAVTTSPTTWSYWLRRFIGSTTRTLAGFLSTSMRWASALQRNGMPAMPAGSGTAAITTSARPQGSWSECSTCAQAAASSSKPASTPSTAPRRAGASTSAPPAPIVSSSGANIAGRSSARLGRTTSGSAVAPALGSTGALRVLRIEQAGRADVWCMEVPDGHTFTLAAGPTVHNCFDELKAALMRRTSNPDQPEQGGGEDPARATGAQVLPDGSHRVANVAR